MIMLKMLFFFDQTNREGHAAKVYFNRLFGKNFSREYECDINSALDYGYAILLSVFNREIVLNGYITQLGIKHINEYNQFNLSCDIMEPFRVIVDWYVYNNRERMFNQEYKYDLINLLNLKVELNDKELYLSNAIKLYTSRVFKAIEKKSAKELVLFRYP
ncbi:MAG: type II CRISPR-associated endonuclease Cas1 [Lachnospira sp.]